MIQKCVICNNVFTVSSNRVKKGYGKYCSRECFHKDQKINTPKGEKHYLWKGQHRNCLICGNDFVATARNIHRGGGKFCSRKCTSIFLSNTRKGEKNPAWNGSTQKRKCLHCGKEFNTKTYRLSLGWGKFCSKSCFYNHNSDTRKGEKNPFWKGGTSYEPYCNLFNKEFKERVRAFFGYTCQLCGSVWVEGEKRLAVHHVNYDKMTCCNDVIPLFVPVCHKNGCHSKTNHNRDKWEVFFTDLLKTKFNGKCYFTKEEYAGFKS